MASGFTPDVEKQLNAFIERMTNNPNNLGILGNGSGYMKTGTNQDLTEEFLKQAQFLKRVFVERVIDEAPELADPNGKLEFINYGDTQMVYVLTANDKQWAVLVTQPTQKCGIGKCEYDNLQRLAEICPELVVKPEFYFTDRDKELYIAPYSYQARCVASQEHDYGIYIPEPYYRFETFSSDIRKNVNTCMIANLVRLYDEENGCGLGACKIGGGDFILEKDWDNTDKSIDATLEHMKLIAAREMIPMSEDDYEQQLLCDFSERTYYNDITDRDPSFLINHKNRVPMTFDEIGEGIELGKRLRKLNRK